MHYSTEKFSTVNLWSLGADADDNVGALFGLQVIFNEKVIRVNSVKLRIPFYQHMNDVLGSSGWMVLQFDVLLFYCETDINSVDQSVSLSSYRMFICIISVFIGS